MKPAGLPRPMGAGGSAGARVPMSAWVMSYRSADGRRETQQLLAPGMAAAWERAFALAVHQGGMVCGFCLARRP